MSRLQVRESRTCCFVVHAIHPYLHDVTQVLALPSGLRYRLRYDGQWVEASLRNSIAKLHGQEALVLFYDDPKNLLFPIRWCRVSVARQVGRIFYFELMLGDLCDYQSDLAARNSQVSGFNETFRGFHHDQLVDKNGERVLEDCVFMSAIGQHVGRVVFGDLTNWGNVVDAVAQARGFEMAEFFKVLDLTDGSGKELSPVQEAYRLVHAKTYNLRVFQIIPNSRGSRGEPHEVELRSFSDQIQVLRNRQTALGKYDVLTYVVRISGLAAGERTALELLVPGSPGRPPMPGFLLPVTVTTPSLMSKAMWWVGLVVSLGLIFTPIVFASGTSAWERAVSFVGVIGFVLSVVGWRSVLKLLGLYGHGS